VLLTRAGMVLTTPAGAERLGDHAVGLVPWQTLDLPAQDGRILRVTGTPARHGPPGGDRGPVTGFVLAPAGSPNSAVYISGDTVWYDRVAEVRRRCSVQIAILFMGATRIREVGPAHLTFTADEAVEAACAFAAATIVPLHYEGWEHLSESRPHIEAAFRLAGLEGQLQWSVCAGPRPAVGLPRACRAGGAYLDRHDRQLHAYGEPSLRHALCHHLGRLCRLAQTIVLLILAVSLLAVAIRCSTGTSR
jgi:Beta-lactamase superfamily domain